MTTLFQAGGHTEAQSSFAPSSASLPQAGPCTAPAGVQLDVFADTAAPAGPAPVQAGQMAVARAATALLPALHAALHAVPPRQATSSGLSHAQLWRAHQHPGASILDNATGIATISTGFPLLDEELPGQGWPQGQLTELLSAQTGIGELRLLFPCLKRLSQSGRTCVWILPPEAGTPGAAPASLPYPPALQAAGLDLAQQVFVRAGTARESIWAMEQCLRSQNVGALIAWLPTGTPPEARFRCLRRLQLLAQSGDSLVFLLGATREAAAASPAALRLQLQASPQEQDLRLHLHILKRRARPLLDPIALQVHPGSWLDKSVSCRPTPAASEARPATWAQRLQQLVSVSNPLAQPPLPNAC